MSCILSFKKEAKVYVVRSGVQYSLDVSNINFGQTFTEHSYSNKTIQVQNMFEQSVINKANPASFDLTFPAIREPDLHILFNRALDYLTFDLYIETPQDTFKIEGCVITQSVFTIEKMRPLSMTISGEGIRLTRTTDPIPGTPEARTGTLTYNLINWLNIILGGAAAEDTITSVSVELATEIEWTPYTTVNDALIAVDADSSMYPSNFTVSKRTLQGSFTKYSIDQIEWNTDTTLFIEVGEKVGSNFYGFRFDIDNISFQNPIQTNDIFTQTYTWRMTQNPISLSQVISYQGITDESRAILDSWGINILDSFVEPILESQ